MKLLLTASMLAFAAPVFAQTTPMPSSPPNSTMTPSGNMSTNPAQNEMPNQAQNSTPNSQQNPAPMPTENAMQRPTENPAQNTGTPSTQVPDTTLSNSPMPSTGPRAQEANQPTNSAADANNSPLATDPARTSAAPAMKSYPICRAGQFDDCMEPGNGSRQSTKKRMRKPR